MARKPVKFTRLRSEWKSFCSELSPSVEWVCWSAPVHGSMPHCCPACWYSQVVPCRISTTRCWYCSGCQPPSMAALPVMVAWTVSIAHWTHTDSLATSWLGQACQDRTEQVSMSLCQHEDNVSMFNVWGVSTEHTKNYSSWVIYHEYYVPEIEAELLSW